MQIKWFNGIKNVEELRKKYRELLKEYHPDNENGSTETAQQINQEYDFVFARLSRESKEGGKSYSREENERFKAILNEIIGFNMTIEVIGSWIWCFSAYEYRTRLKQLGFTWCGKKKAWAWHSEPYSRHHNKEIPLSHIRLKYGSEIISKKSKQFAIN